jgi:hypothetical protein
MSLPDRDLPESPPVPDNLPGPVIPASVVLPIPVPSNTVPINTLPVVLPPALPARWRSSLAQRISSRTTDILAIAVVLIGSLTLGRQILEWWRAEPPAILDAGPLAGLETEWGANQQGVELQFADSPIRLIRQEVTHSGPLEMLGLIQETCQKALLAAQPLELPPDQAERDMLQAVQDRHPEAEQPGAWQIHRLGSNMVMLVGVRFFPAAVQKSSPDHPALTPRVICWGLVFPGHSAGSWTGYTFIKNNSKSTQASQNPASGHVDDLDLGQVELPADCQRTVAVRSAGWNSLSGFQGPGTPAKWRTHFSRWLASHHWTPVEAWHEAKNSNSWSASFIQNQENNQDNTDQSNRVLIQFQFDASGQGSGLIHGLPGRAANPKP